MIWSIFNKSIKEQLRNYWVLLLTVLLAPFFVFVYYLMMEAYEPRYDILILNNDAGMISEDHPLSYGQEVQPFIKAYVAEINDAPLKVRMIKDKALAMEKLRQKKADVLMIIPPDFSKRLKTNTDRAPEVEMMGDLSSIAYMVSAVWLGEIMNDFMASSTGQRRLYTVKETALGNSGELSEFDMLMPGMLILSIIMLMFSATIAIITEVDQKTILRLKLSDMKAWQFLVGIGGTQVLVGISSILLTLTMATFLGFEMQGSFLIFLLVTIMTCISMIAFSLILAAFTRSVTDVLVIGNFPLFLFMFFTGAAFPIKGVVLFNVGGYGITWQGIMSPTHAINALNKICILGLDFSDIIPELSVLMGLTVVYFGIGVWAFQWRHLQTS